MKREDEACDRALVAIAQGKKEALDVIYTAYGRMICSAAYQILRSTEDAEDVLQDVLIRVGENAFRYTPNSNPRAWVMSIAKNITLDLLRKRHGEISLEEMPPHESLEAKGYDSEEMILLRDALQALSPEERLIVNLKTYAGLSHKEIADVLKITPEGAQKRYERAIGKLRKYFS